MSRLLTKLAVSKRKMGATSGGQLCTCWNYIDICIQFYRNYLKILILYVFSIKKNVYITLLKYNQSPYNHLLNILAHYNNDRKSFYIF